MVWVKALLAVLTVATGVWSLIKPRSITGFTGITSTGTRGVTEIRAVFGGFLIAWGVAPLIWGGAVYLALGLSYLVVAVVRAISILVDRSSVRSNWISLAVEVVFGCLLVI